jgi:choline dehydrogenase-like flavoprotein
LIIDADGIENGSLLQADLCIVGAGAAGITLALAFAHTTHTVIMLEAGGWQSEAATQALYDGSLAGPGSHPPLNRFRRRAFGGSTGIWGGRCVPFDPVDFAARPWMPGLGWPLALEEIERFYENAARICEIGEPTFTAEAAFPRGMRRMLPGFAGTHFTDDRIERFSCPTDFARRYGGRLRAAPHITVVLHANVVQLRTAADGARIETVQAESMHGRHFSVQAAHVVLAAGGLEVPRLLLASRDHHTVGIGNAHDQVGRCYMTHLAGTIGEIIPAPGNMPFLGYDIADDGTYCRRRFALTETAQRELGVGNFIARLHPPRLHDPVHRTGALSAVYLARPFIAYEYARRLHGQTRLPLAAQLGHLRNVVLDAPGVASFALHFLARRKLAARKFPSLVVTPKSGRYSLDFHAEHAPNPASRITLTRERDRLGMPKIQVDWRIADIDRRTVTASLAALAQDLVRSGCAVRRCDPDEIARVLQQEGAYGGHHIGTARMSASPRDGVVDPQCRVHGMQNLFVAGSAVFPTAGQANPTLTIVALALRLAKELKKELLF